MLPKVSEKRNVLLLVTAQALFQIVSVIVMTLSSLVGLKLAADPGLATLPVTFMVLGVAVAIIPASLFMQKWGRRAGFMLGTTLGCLAGLLAAIGIGKESFALFLGASCLIGAYQGFAQYYRFAAAEVASEALRSQSISWVIAGGVLAAILAPIIAEHTQSLGTVPFLYSYLAIFALSFMALLVVAQVVIPDVKMSPEKGEARRIQVILRQPLLITALLGSSVSYGVLMTVMTVTPVAMKNFGHSLSASTSVIQWSVIGMYLPSFFTGHLIRRWGEVLLMCSGLLLLFAQVFVANSGTDFIHFLAALILLGVGWNFLFVASTSLLTQAYRPAERGKIQALHDFVMFAAVSLGTFSSGHMLEAWGWNGVNRSVLPFLVLACIPLGILALKRPRSFVDSVGRARSGIEKHQDRSH
jgi:MFS family permease